MADYGSVKPTVSILWIGVSAKFGEKSSAAAELAQLDRVF